MTNKKSSDFDYGTIEYYNLRVCELEQERNIYKTQADYYQTELAKSHELLGRIVHQTSERWDSVQLTKFYPTDNLHGKRTLNNPSGKQ